MPKWYIAANTPAGDVNLCGQTFKNSLKACRLTIILESLSIIRQPH